MKQSSLIKGLILAAVALLSFQSCSTYRNINYMQDLQAGKMNVKMPDTEIKPRGGRIIE